MSKTTRKKKVGSSSGKNDPSVSKHKKILRDNINGITDPAIRRLLRKASVKRINGYVYNEIREIIKSMLTDLCSNIIDFMVYNRRVTVQSSDISAALEIRGLFLAASLNPNAKTTFHSSFGHSHKKKKTESETPHKFKPGTVALREIRKEQKSTFFAIPKANFSRLVREVSQDFKDDVLRFSEGVIDLLQVAVEETIIKICSKAYLLSLHAKRETLQPVDLQLVLNIKKFW